MSVDSRAMRRRQVLAVCALVAGAGCVGDGGGDPETDTGSDDTEDDGESTDEEASGDGGDSASDGGGVDATVEYNYQVFDKLQPPNQEGVFYESTDEEQYVGAQLRIGNETDEALELHPQAVSVFADGSPEDVSLHAQSAIDDAVAEIPPDEPVETWAFYVTPPDAELGFGTTQWAEHDLEVVENEDLELAIQEYEE